MHTIRISVLLGTLAFAVYAQREASREIAELNGVPKVVLASNHDDDRDVRYFMSRAIELGRNAFNREHERPFGCVVVRGGEIVGEGWSRFSSSDDPSGHAAIDAVRDAFKNIPEARLDGCVVYSNGQPCRACNMFLSGLGISSIFYCVPSDQMSETNGEIKSANAFRSVPEFQVFDGKADSVLSIYR